VLACMKIHACSLCSVQSHPVCGPACNVRAGTSLPFVIPILYLLETLISLSYLISLPTSAQITCFSRALVVTDEKKMEKSLPISSALPAAKITKIYIADRESLSK
jgi:hypothetical protein